MPTMPAIVKTKAKKPRMVVMSAAALASVTRIILIPVKKRSDLRTRMMRSARSVETLMGSCSSSTSTMIASHEMSTTTKSSRFQPSLR